MEALNFNELESITGGGFWDGFCVGIGVAGGVGTITAGLVKLGVVTISSGPAAGVVGVGLGVLGLGCAAYAFSRLSS